MITCPYCGTENRAQATYCNTCGGLLGQGQAGAAGASSNHQGQTPPHHATGRLAPHTLIAGRYHVVRAVGHGGMAAVYQAADLRSNRIIALKEMSQDGLSPDEVRESIAAFRFEAETLTRLRHPNLPQVYEYFSEGGRHYLAMEFINGQTLEERLQAAGGKPLPETEVLGWARQVGAVLSYLHRQQPPIIFRDLKPANIMLTGSGEIKLIDFGIARLFAPGHTRDTQILGTPGFAPPEQYGKAQTDARADIYALGCTLYQLLTAYDPGTTPFALPPMRSRNPAITPSTQLVIERATKLDRDQRFATVDDFGRALLNPPGLVFFNGAVAHNATELLALCRQQPQEAAEHLAYGRIETWLRAWGNTPLAQAAANARARTSDRAAALTAFLDASAHAQQPLFGPWSTRALKLARKLATNAAQSGRQTGGTTTTTRGGAAQRASQPSATRPRAAASAAAPPVAIEVRPRSVLFGRLPQGQRGTCTIAVSGAHGARVSGKVTSGAAWLRTSLTRFDGASTLIDLSAETSLIPAPGIQQTTLTITSAGQQVAIPVTVEVLRAVTPTIKQRAIGKAANAAKGSGASAAQSTSQTAKSPASAKSQSTSQAKSRKAPKTRPVPTAHAPLALTVVLAFILALVAGQGVVLGAAHLWPAVAHLLPFQTPERVGVLTLVLLGASLAAYLATAITSLGSLSAITRREAVPRLATTVAWGALGLGLAFATAAPVRALLHIGVPLLVSSIAATPPGLVLVLGLVAVGTALGAEARASAITRAVVRFVWRWLPVFTAAGLVVAGGFTGHWLLSGVLGGICAGVGLVLGVIVGGMLGARLLSTTRQLRRARLRRTPQAPRFARARP